MTEQIIENKLTQSPVSALRLSDQLRLATSIVSRCCDMPEGHANPVLTQLIKEILTVSIAKAEELETQAGQRLTG